MGYYRLKESYVLRGWERLPWALIRRPQNDIEFLDRELFEALQICNGKCDCDFCLVSDRTKQLISLAIEKGVVEPCKYGEGLTSDQEYRRYSNRFIHTVHWSITGKCNYKCKHCYMSAPEAKLGELSHKTIMDIIDQLEACGVLSVTLTGGEPLIRKDWWEIVDALTERHIAIQTIYSNGYLVREELLDGLIKRGLKPEFNMSYDGDEGWHDWLRGIPGAGKAVLRAFDLCHEKGFPVGAELCIHKGNKHLLRESIQTLARHHCTHLKVNPVADTELWERFGKDYSISPTETLETYLDYIPAYFADKRPLSLMLGGFFYCSAEDENIRWQIPLKKYNGSDNCLKQTVCGHARQVLYLSPEGRMLPCMSLSSFDIQENYPLITTVGLQKGLTDSAYMKLIDTRIEEFLAHTKECGACEYAKICAGGCRASALCFDRTNIMAPDRAACLIFRGGYGKRLQEVVKKCTESGQTPPCIRQP